MFRYNSSLPWILLHFTDWAICKVGSVGIVAEKVVTNEMATLGESHRHVLAASLVNRLAGEGGFVRMATLGRTLTVALSGQCGK